jgi:hypothetical protein
MQYQVLLTRKEIDMAFDDEILIIEEPEDWDDDWDDFDDDYDDDWTCLEDEDED